MHRHRSIGLLHGDIVDEQRNVSPRDDLAARRKHFERVDREPGGGNLTVVDAREPALEFGLVIGRVGVGDQAKLIRQAPRNDRLRSASVEKEITNRRLPDLSAANSHDEGRGGRNRSNLVARRQHASRVQVAEGDANHFVRRPKSRRQESHPGAGDLAAQRLLESASRGHVE